MKIKYARPTVKKCKTCLQVGGKNGKSRRTLCGSLVLACVPGTAGASAAGTGWHTPAPHNPRQQSMCQIIITPVSIHGKCL